MKILYVENHPAFVAAVTREFLRDHEVDVIPTVEGAKQRSIEQYDLILCDYDLDDGKGSEYIQHLRTFNSTVPVIAVSSHSRGN